MGVWIVAIFYRGGARNMAYNRIVFYSKDIPTSFQMISEAGYTMRTRMEKDTITSKFHRRCSARYAYARLHYGPNFATPKSI